MYQSSNGADCNMGNILRVSFFGNLFLFQSSSEENHVEKVNIFQSIRDFKTPYVLTMNYISASKEILTLMLNIQIIQSSNKIWLLQKQQFVTYFVKNLNNRCHLHKTAEFYFLYFTSSVQKYEEYAFCSSQSSCSMVTC